MVSAFKIHVEIQEDSKSERFQKLSRVRGVFRGTRGV